MPLSRMRGDRAADVRAVAVAVRSASVAARAGDEVARSATWPARSWCVASTPVSTTATVTPAPLSPPCSCAQASGASMSASAHAGAVDVLARVVQPPQLRPSTWSACEPVRVRSSSAYDDVGVGVAARAAPASRRPRGGDHLGAGQRQGLDQANTGVGADVALLGGAQAGVALDDDPRRGRRRRARGSDEREHEKSERKWTDSHHDV